MSKSKITETLLVTNKAKIALALARIVVEPNIPQPITFKTQKDLDLANSLHKQGVIEISAITDTVEEVQETKIVEEVKEEVKVEPKTLTEEEIKGLSKKDALKFMKDNELDLGVHSRSGAPEVTNALLTHFGFEPVAVEAE